MLHCGKHELDIVRVSGYGQVRVDLGPAKEKKFSYKYVKLI